MQDPHINPYAVDDSGHCNSGSRIAARFRSLGATSVRFWFALVFLLFLFLPTVQYYQRDVPLGRVPLWAAYVLVFDGEFYVVAISAVILHLLASLLCSLLLAYCTSGWKSKPSRITS